MAETIRGDGLNRIEGSLAALAADQRRLDYARMRFSDSPPSYTSHQSRNSTRPQSPNQPSNGERLREEQRWQLIRERDASLPYNQRQAQEIEELQRIFENHQNGTHIIPIGTNFEQLAQENAKRRWEEQGIWNHTLIGESIQGTPDRRVSNLKVPPM
jgi:hypothetical protein